MNINVNYGCGNSVLLKQRVVDTVRKVTVGNDLLGEPVVKHYSDVHLLMHEEKLLQKMGLDQLKQWISDLQNTLSAPSPVDYSKFTDEQLMKFVKSRYIQAPADVQAWSEQLTNECSKLRMNFTSYLKSLIPIKKETTDSSVNGNE